MAIGRLIAKSLLRGWDVGVKGFGVFVNEAPVAQQHVHEKHRIWTSPRRSIVFRVDEAIGFSADVDKGEPRGFHLLSALLSCDGGLDPHDAERMSAAWANDVRSELLESGISVLRGLGTFTLSDGIAHFEQDEDFPSMAEMPAIYGYSEELAHVESDNELIEDPPSSLVSPDTDVSMEGTSTVEGPTVDHVDVDVGEEHLEAEDHSETALEATDSPQEAPHTERTEDPIEGVGTSDMAGSADSPEKEISEATGDEPAADEVPIVPPPARSRSPRRYERSEGDSSKAAVWIIGVVSLIVLIALIYRFGRSPASTEPALAEQEIATDDSTSASLSDSSLVIAQADTDSAAGANPDEATESPTSSADGSEEPIPPDAPVEAHSDDLVRGMGGYTLVVGSTLNEITARQALGQFSSLELPMGVLGYESDDATRYRIAVGHYETAALADSARAQRANELPAGTWVLAIR